jgi:antitoxin VapB
MTLSLKDQETDSLARQVARLTGETLTEAVRGALRLRLRDEQLKRGERPWDDAAIDAIIARFNMLPVFDYRPADEILGYDENGLPS